MHLATEDWRPCRRASELVVRETLNASLSRDTRSHGLIQHQRSRSRLGLPRVASRSLSGWAKVECPHARTFMVNAYRPQVKGLTRLVTKGAGTSLSPDVPHQSRQAWALAPETQDSQTYEASDTARLGGDKICTCGSCGKPKHSLVSLQGPVPSLVSISLQTAELVRVSETMLPPPAPDGDWRRRKQPPDGTPSTDDIGISSSHPTC